MSDYNYDEQGQFFPFFMLTMVGLVTVPLTFNVFKASTDLEQTATRIQSDFKPKDDDIIQAQRRKQKRKERKIKRILAMLMGYAFMAYMVYLIVVTQRTSPKIWDPYDILGVSRVSNIDHQHAQCTNKPFVKSASESDIRGFYRRLSVKYHPDKARPDPSKNETLDTINDRWVEMTKAFKSLTDEEVRNNYLQYGNPDGKQSTSIGIALPKWMVEEGNRWVVVAFYGLFLGVLLPYTVGKWWYGTQALTKDKVLHSSAGKLFRQYKDDLTEGAIVSALSVGDEYKESFKGAQIDAGASKVESKVMASGVLSPLDVAKLKEIDDPLRRKILSLLWAYLGRVELDDAELEKQKYEVVPQTLQLINSFAAITQPFLNVGPLLAAYHTSQNIVQAIAPGKSPLLQLPHFTQQAAEKISESRAKAPLTIQMLMALPAQLRRNLCSDLSDSQYSQAMHVASQMPHLHVAKVFFKVVGERVVTPGSQVQLVVKARAIPPGTKDVPPVDPLDLEDIDPDEDDIDAIKGRRTAKNTRRKDADGNKIEDHSILQPVQPPLAYAPYFPADHAPRWHVFLSEARTGRIAVHPTTFTAFDKPIFTVDGKPTFNMLTLKYPFIAPPQVANYPFVMHMVCDSYIGMDTTVPVTLEIKDVSEAHVVESEDEISEPDEGKLTKFTF